MTEPGSTGAGATHLDLDELADALAGEPHEHLAGCADCTSRLAELEAAEAGLLAALRALPAPEVPADLADRLSAVLAAEPPLAAPDAPAPANVTALPAAAPRRRFLPAAAAAVLLVSGGGLGYALVSGSSGSDESASDSGAEAAGAASDLVTSASGTDYADAASVEAVLPGVLAGTAASVLSMDSAAGATQAQPPSEEARSSTMQAPEVTTAMGDPLARLRTPAGLEDCLSAVLPPEEPDLRPRALDYATYEGQPALAVVLPDPDPAKLSVFVVGAECAAADAKVLGFLRVDAP